MSLVCTLALVLSLDVSASITPEEWQLETQGIYDGLSAPEVQTAIKEALPIAIRVDQWSSVPANSIPWTLIRNMEDLAAFQEAVKNADRLSKGGTYLAKGLQYSINSFKEAPCDPDKKVIDISGDGKDSDDLEGELYHWEINSKIKEVVKSAIDYDIVINGLPILNPNAENDADVVEYYIQEVATPTGFVIQATGFEDVGKAMRRKLQQEISYKDDSCSDDAVFCAEDTYNTSRDQHIRNMDDLKRDEVPSYGRGKPQPKRRY